MSKNNENKKTYTVKDFCVKYLKLNSEDARKLLVDNIVNSRYVPYLEKVTTCKNIAQNTCYKKSIVNDIEVEDLYMDSPAQYLFYCLCLVNAYSYLNVDLKNPIEEFDLLNGSGLLDLIISKIPKKETEEFKMILDFVIADIVQNEYEVHSFITKQVQRYGELIQIVSKPLLQYIDIYMKENFNFNEDIEDINKENSDKDEHSDSYKEV